MRFLTQESFRPKDLVPVNWTKALIALIPLTKVNDKA